MTPAIDAALRKKDAPAGRAGQYALNPELIVGVYEGVFYASIIDQWHDDRYTLWGSGMREGVGVRVRLEATGISAYDAIMALSGIIAALPAGWEYSTR